MLRFFAGRVWLFVLAVLLLALASLVVWNVWSHEPLVAVVLGVSVMAAGLGVLIYVRMVRAVRELYRMVSDLKDDLATFKEGALGRAEGIRLKTALDQSDLTLGAVKEDLGRSRTDLASIGAGLHEVERELAELREELTRTREEDGPLRWRISLAERRLSKLAIKLEATDELDEKPWS